MKKSAGLTGAIAAALGTGATHAATVDLYLVAVREHIQGAFAPRNITSSTATWTYDDVSGLLTQTGGTFNVRFNITTATTLFRHSITGLVVGNGASASADTFTCSEGNFGANVGASLCGNYNFGANFANESAASWGPGTAFHRTIGGDDISIGPQQSINLYNGFDTISWDGTTLEIGNAACSTSVPGSAANCGQDYGATYPYGYNTGYSFRLQTTVPLPAAFWLFGSAMAGLGWLKRKTKT